jgi:phosphoglycerol transferase MdoB-like AlkP superfamily enzyme
MNLLLRSLTVFSNRFRQFGICATVGFIAGNIAGFFLLLLFLAQGGTALILTSNQALQIALILTLFDVIVLLFFLVALSRYKFSSVLLPALINCLLTCLITTLLVSSFNLWQWSIIVGMLVGLIIGRLFCILSCRLQGDRTHVLH